MAKRSKSLRTNSAGRTIKSFKGSKRTYPIKDPEALKRFIGWFDIQYRKASGERKRQADRNRMVILTALNTAFRSEDVLQLRVCDMVDGHISIKENKTGKFQSFDLNPGFTKMVRSYVERNQLSDQDYLFQPRQSMSRSHSEKESKIYALPVTRVRMNQIINKAISAAGINYSVGMHGLRKTFGYWYIKNGGNPFTLQRMYCHSMLATTERYVMWGTEDVDAARANMQIGFTTPHKKGR